jgi:hypothetical protein
MKGARLMSVGSCSKGFYESVIRHGKSPCFLAYAILASIYVDYGGSAFAVFNIAGIQE